jgi:plasmid stabilization system protein ParE
LALTEYKIEIEHAAERDMYDTLLYITETLKGHASALRIYKSIKEQIGKLSTMPVRNRVVYDQPYASIGVRRLFVENYVVFYVIDETALIVHVIRVLYNRREWQSILSTEI